MSVNPDAVVADDSNELQIQQFKLKKTIQRLGQYQGSGSSVITLLIPPSEQVSAITGMLTTEFGTASNIKSRVNRQAVLSAITSAINRLKRYSRIPPNGLALFTGEILDPALDGKPRKILVDIVPFKPLANFTYLCDSKFHLESLQDLLVDDDAYGFIIMDGACSLFGRVCGQAKTVLQKIFVDLPKKHGRGGQSSVRFARLREEARKNYVRKVAELSNGHYISLQTNKPNVAGLILAGSADFKNVLANSDVLDYRLRDVVIKQIDINYGGEQGFSQAIDLSGDVLRDVRLMREVRLINEFLELIARDTKKYCFGVVDTVRCLELSSVDKLVLWEELDVWRVVFRDASDTGAGAGTGAPAGAVDAATAAAAALANERPQGGDDEGIDVEEFGAAAAYEKAQKVIVKYLTTADLANPRSFVNKETGEAMDELGREQLTEWLAVHYKDFGCTLELVSDRSSEGSQFCRGFGGIGAILRWQIDTNELGRMIEGDDADDDIFEELSDFI